MGILRIAVVGAGPMGRHHALAAASLSAQARVVAVMDRDRDRADALAAELGAGARGYDTLEAMLADARPDVVHVCTSPVSHAPVATAALEAGAHVYVEKPFTEDPADAHRLFALAAQRGLRITAGHQLLYERPTLIAADLLPRLGAVQHVESFFAFRQATRPGGHVPYTPAEQLLDILPHPAYLLFHFLGPAAAAAPPDIRGLRVDDRGAAHVVVASGDATGVLVATLRGRPVDSYVRIVGTRGTLTLDYVRGIVLPSIGAGSTIEKILDPYARAWRSAIGTTGSLARRFLKRQRSYPGLAEAFAAFYRHVQGGPPPYPAASILRTVELCGAVDAALREAAATAAAPPAPAEPPTVAVTGGTGLLGRRVVRALIARGVTPLALSRRLPRPADREPGAHYASCDLASARGLTLPATVTTVIHCAAETAGSWDAHQRNSIDATTHVLDAMRTSGARQLVHVSSLAVIDADATQPLNEASPVEREPRRRGAYVWGKLLAEQAAMAAPTTHGLECRVVRPGALVDAAAYDPPGKLGRLIGSWFIAFDNPGATIPISDLDRVAQILAWEATHFASAPALLNAVDPQPATRRELLARLRADRPGTRVVWVVRPMLVALSLALTILQRVLRPRHTPVNLATVFAAPRCDTTAVRALLPALEQGPPTQRTG